MTLFQSIILGIVQGLTEFFPISSSAHLKLTKMLLHIPDGEHLVFFDLCAHLGTVLALILFLRKEIIALFSNKKLILQITLALLPLVPAYFLLKKVRIYLSNPSYLGFFLLVTALLLLIATRIKKENGCREKWSDVLWIGMMQTLALIPGISRSGSTIATAKFLGWSWKEGALFSFLLAIPAVVGGSFLEVLKFNSGVSLPLQLSCYVSVFLSSFCTGLLGVRFIFWIYEKEKIIPFVLYCLILAILVIVYA